MPKLSVIIPVYNVEMYLRKCLDSVLASTFTDFELILVDDGSKDSSGKLCDEFALKDDRIKLFHIENGGVSRARNIGIDHATAPWITFIDSDDFIAPTFLEHLYVAVEEHPDVDFVQAGCTNYKNGKIADIEQTYDPYYGNDMNYLFPIFRGLIFCKLYKTGVLNENNVKFDEKVCGAEDFFFTMDYLSHTNTYTLLSEKGYYYRRDNCASLTHTTMKSSYETEMYAFQYFNRVTESYICKHQVKDTSLRKTQMANKLFFALVLLYHSNYDRKKRLRCLKTDITDTQLSLLRYVKGKKNKIITTILRMKLYRLCDYACIKII